MITTVTLNAAIDKTYYLPRFPIGQVTRVSNMSVDAGGKGLNVARVIKQLGFPVMAAGFVGGYNGQYIENTLKQSGIPHDFVHVDGESRICLNIIDESAATSSELLEPGPSITEEQIGELKRKLAGLAARSRVVCFSGSLPAGVPLDIYADLIRIAKAEGAFVFLDTSGEALRCGLEAGPCLIKPNEEEAIALLGKAGGGEEDYFRALEDFCGNRISRTVVSLGGSGALALWEGSRYRIRIPAVPVVNTVGSGDAFLAGMAAALADGRGPEDCLRLAAAAGTANALQRRTGWVEPADVDNLLGLVTVESAG
ncbi:1-phosphofructokinase [Paenibacillus humicola]|uniref:1-phosphofructokinase n=1 Tax=Paenibacillus humicola TaxID=3110540 RepID=UPI00237AC824|nr:1-phosphofructokinase [Paenibacillus humicola]